MTGPEHYKAAEDAITASTWQRQTWGEHDASSDAGEAALDAALWEMRRAQVHATLALAAATAMNDFNPHGDGMPAPDWSAWKTAAATPAPPEDDE